MRFMMIVKPPASALEWAKRILFGTEVHPGEEVEVEVRRIAEPSELDT